jgi:hypothetical protein
LNESLLLRGELGHGGRLHESGDHIQHTCYGENAKG